MRLSPLAAVLLLGSVSCGPAATTVPSQVLDPGTSVVVVLGPPRESLTVSCEGRPQIRTQADQVTGRVVSALADTVRLRVTAIRSPGAERETALGGNCEAALLRDSTTSWTVLSRHPRAVQAGVFAAWLVPLLGLALFFALLYPST